MCSSGALGRTEVTRHGTVDPFWFTRVAESVVEAGGVPRLREMEMHPLGAQMCLNPVP